MAQNITYKSEEILSFYSNNRQCWEDFYPSERWVFERIAGDAEEMGDVLDVGCAGGGLGAALSERFQLLSYTGIDIHEGIIDWAISNRVLTVPVEFYAADISTVQLDRSFDVVVSLGCADWNLDTGSIIQACWDRVKPGGYFVVSLRLTTGSSVNDMSKSYQHINFSGDDPDPETANYVVTNCREALKMLNGLGPAPDLIGAYGYWGKPSSTAVTPFEQILFSVLFVRKGTDDQGQARLELHWPADVLTGGAG